MTKSITLSAGSEKKVKRESFQFKNYEVTVTFFFFFLEAQMYGAGGGAPVYPGGYPGMNGPVYSGVSTGPMPSAPPYPSGPQMPNTISHPMPPTQPVPLGSPPAQPDTSSPSSCILCELASRGGAKVCITL